jgi:hypothetical protein
MRKSNWFSALSITVAVISGCATGPTVRIDKDPAANLAAYKTFAFFEQLATDRARYSTITTSRLKQATMLEMKKLGYVYDEANPQLRVNFFLNVSDRQKVQQTPGAGPARFRGYGTWYGYETVDYKAGTLGIEIVDVTKNVLVWQGVAEGKVSAEAMKNPGPALDATVAEIFRNFTNVPAMTLAAVSLD